MYRLGYYRIARKPRDWCVRPAERCHPAATRRPPRRTTKTEKGGWHLSRKGASHLLRSPLFQAQKLWRSRRDGRKRCQPPFREKVPATFVVRQSPDEVGKNLQYKE